MNILPGYERLAEVLQNALDQAQSGKGKERHACGELFEQQEICQNTRAVGFGYPLGQARKKAKEAKRLIETVSKDAGIAECLGAINYLVAAVIVMDEQDNCERLEKQPNHIYTDEEPEHRMRNKPCSPEEDDAFELLTGQQEWNDPTPSDMPRG
jgi:hypothetical protein